ncbi:MAG: hypothetical protein EOO65_00960 [Methanosarcinales archaeon]|nr:MAG: hypothetical protein EOO65_00960 [Methanosarcinales archaeon]
MPEHSAAVVEHAGDDGNVTTEEAKVDDVVASPSTREKHLLEEHYSHCIHRVAAYTSAEIIASPVAVVEGAAGGAAAASSDAVVPEFEEAATEAAPAHDAHPVKTKAPRHSYDYKLRLVQQWKIPWAKLDPVTDYGTILDIGKVQCMVCGSWLDVRTPADAGKHANTEKHQKVLAEFAHTNKLSVDARIALASTRMDTTDGSASAEELASALTVSMVRSGLSFSAVKKILSHGAPARKALLMLPSATQHVVPHVAVPGFVHKYQLDLIEEVRAQPSYSLLIDDSRRLHGFRRHVSLVYVMSPAFEQPRFLRSFIQKKAYTAGDIEAMLNVTIEAIGAGDPVSVATDNAATNLCAMHSLAKRGIAHSRCTARGIQLVYDAVLSCVPSLKNALCGLSYFSSSSRSSAVHEKAVECKVDRTAFGYSDWRWCTTLSSLTLLSTQEGWVRTGAWLAAIKTLRSRECSKAHNSWGRRHLRDAARFLTTRSTSSTFASSRGFASRQTM